MLTYKNTRYHLYTLVLLSLLFSGCATLSSSPDQRNANNIDPLEGLNRGIFGFNKLIDKAILKPIAETYDAIVPEALDIGITNFFSNLNELVVIGNDLLQFKLKQAAEDSGRFLLNTGVGFLGFFDPATEYGLMKHDEDFGQTLGYWGVANGPYLVLPVFGSSSLRDAGGMLVDYNLDPRVYAHDNIEYATYGFTVLDLVDTRADLLGAEKLLDTASIDDYIFMRDAYLQRRRALVKDGEVSASDRISDDELFGDE